MKIIRIITIVPLLMLLASCVKEPVEKHSNPDKRVSVQLSFRIQTPKPPVSRSVSESGANSVTVEVTDMRDAQSTRSAGTTSLYNMWVFQFDENGNKVLATKLPNTPEPIKDMVTMDVDLVVGTNQTLYLVTLGEQCDDDLSGIATLSGIRDYSISYLEAMGGVYFSKINSDRDLPYAGYAEGVEIVQLGDGDQGLIKYNSESSFAGGVDIQCLVAKVTLNFSFDVPGYSISSLILKSVSDFLSIYSVDESMIQYTDMNPIDPGALETDEQGRKTFSWYVARNLQGEKSAIITETDRHAEHAPVNATKIEVWASRDSSPMNFLAYSIYVGNNNTSNFDVEGGCQYILRTDINSSDTNDKRIMPFVLQPGSELSCSSTAPSNNLGMYDLDAHYDSRLLTIIVSKAHTAIEILDAATNAPLDDSWLKISSYSNYTDAFRRSDLKTNNEVTLTVPSKLQYYLYNDEYVIPDAPSRSVKVRVTTTSLEDSAVSAKEFTVVQRSIVNLGYFGGGHGPDGNYVSRLGVETVEEYLWSYSPGQTISRPNWGFRGYFINDTYGTDNKIWGKSPTRNLVENSLNYPVGSSIPNPVRINGLLDLYQYNYYNTYYARYCFDKNRDLNGNGIIDDDEYKWYLPAIHQSMAIMLAMRTNSRIGIVPGGDGTGNGGNYSSATGFWNTNGNNHLTINCNNFIVASTSREATNLRARCVRDIN